MEDSKKNALGLLVETYKLYAAFCAIFIAGLLSFVSTIEHVRSLNIFYISLLSLSSSSLVCILGLQYFISKAYNDNCDIYSKTAKTVMISIMFFIALGIGSGVVFIIKQDKTNLFSNIVKPCE